MDLSTQRCRAIHCRQSRGVADRGARWRAGAEHSGPRFGVSPRHALLLDGVFVPACDWGLSEEEPAAAAARARIWLAEDTTPGHLSLVIKIYFGIPTVSDCVGPSD